MVRSAGASCTAATRASTRRPEVIHTPAVLQGPETPPAFPNPPLFSQAAVPPATGAAPSPVASPVESLEISGGVTLELVRIEPGPFTLGSDDGYPNERPAHPHTIDHPFLMGRFEITNRQYACFDPAHDSGLETGEAYQFGDDERGFPLNRAEQPVVRVSWDRALAFCAGCRPPRRRFSSPRPNGNTSPGSTSPGRRSSAISARRQPLRRDPLHRVLSPLPPRPAPLAARRYPV